MSGTTERTVRTRNIRGPVADIPGLTDYIVGLGYATTDYVDAGIADLVIVASPPSARVAITTEVITGYHLMVDTNGNSIKVPSMEGGV